MTRSDLSSAEWSKRTRKTHVDRTKDDSSDEERYDESQIIGQVDFGIVFRHAEFFL
jgi:hypothetical protein